MSVWMQEDSGTHTAATDIVCTPDNATLLNMARRYPPPQSWWDDETLDPFEPPDEEADDG